MDSCRISIILGASSDIADSAFAKFSSRGSSEKPSSFGLVTLMILSTRANVSASRLDGMNPSNRAISEGSTTSPSNRRGANFPGSWPYVREKRHLSPSGVRASSEYRYTLRLALFFSDNSAPRTGARRVDGGEAQYGSALVGWAAYPRQRKFYARAAVSVQTLGVA